MKTCKAVFVTAVFLLFAMNINAQEKKATFGVKVGLNISDVGSTDSQQFDNTNAKAGFHAGFTLDYAFTHQWYLLTGLEYTSKGVKIDLGGKNYDQDVTAAYIQLPLCGGFKFRISESIAVLAGLGPYFAYGLHGEIKTGTSHKQDTFDDNTLKRFDCGMVFGCALEWQKLCFGMGGDIGMVNVMQKNNSKAENRNFTISVGYKF